MSSFFANLRESFSQMGAISLDLPKQTPTASHVWLASRLLAEKLALPDVPRSEQHDKLQLTFTQWLEGDGLEPSPEDWELAPFVYFRGSPALGAHPQFASRVAGRLDTERRPRCLKRTIYVYLRDFRQEDALVKELGALIVRCLPRHEGIWATEWLARAASPVELFHPEGLPARLAARTFEGDEDPRSVLRQLGLSTDLMTFSGIHPPLAWSLTAELNSRFARSTKVADQSVRGMMGFLSEGDSLRFPELRIPIADRLLSPFAGRQDPDDMLRIALTSFFERLYGNPRIRPQLWEGVGPDARRVMLRWAVRQSLEAFFDVLSKTADPIWRYRRAFWLALYRYGLIDDAWAVFGKNARNHVATVSSRAEELTTHGELRGVAAQQSVMLMKMRGFTVAEWSHGGACRIWSADDTERAPALGQRIYDARTIREDCLFDQRHAGQWQHSLSDWIAQRTGVHVPMHELFAARQSG